MSPVDYVSQRGNRRFPALAAVAWPSPAGCLAPRLFVELREPPFIASVGFHDVHLPVVQEGDRAPVG